MGVTDIVQELDVLRGDLKEKWKVSGFTDVIHLEDEEETSVGNEDLTLVGKIFSSKWLADAKVEKELKEAWELSEVPLFSKKMGLFHVVFNSESSLQKVVEEGPWIVDGYAVIFDRWKRNDSMADYDFNRLKVWVQVRGLPLDRITEPDVRKLGGGFGEVKQVDVKSGMNTSTPFARIQVMLNIKGPLIKEARVECKGKIFIITFRYEGIPKFCFFCGCIGHEIAQCRALSKTNKDNRVILERRNQINYSSWLKTPRLISLGAVENQRGEEDDRSPAKLQLPAADQVNRSGGVGHSHAGNDAIFKESGFTARNVGCQQENVGECGYIEMDSEVNGPRQNDISNGPVNNYENQVGLQLSTANGKGDGFSPIRQEILTYDKHHSSSPKLFVFNSSKPETENSPLNSIHSKTKFKKKNPKSGCSRAIRFEPSLLLSWFRFKGDNKKSEYVEVENSKKRIVADKEVFANKKIRSSGYGTSESSQNSTNGLYGKDIGEELGDFEIPGLKIEDIPKDFSLSDDEMRMVVANGLEYGYALFRKFGDRKNWDRQIEEFSRSEPPPQNEPLERYS